MPGSSRSRTSSEASASIRITTPALTAIVSTDASQRPRGGEREAGPDRERARRGPARAARARRRGARSPPRRIAAGARRAARHAGQVAAAVTSATTAARPASSGSASAAPGACSLSAPSSDADGPRHRERADRDPRGRRGERDQRRLARVASGDRGAGEAERALDADRPQPALDVGVGAGREHRPRGQQRDERERDEQRDHDAGRLGEEDPDALAGDERQRPDAERGRARLRERDVLARGIVQPEQRDVGPDLLAEAERVAHLLLAEIDPRGARERERDVVGRQRDPRHAQVAEVLERERVAGQQVPLLAPARARSPPRRAAGRGRARA